MFAQELLLPGDEKDAFSARMYRQGWKCAIVPSVSTAAGGLSSGVLIASPTCCGMAPLSNGKLDAKWDASPRDSPGRLAVAWIDAVVKGGVLAGSVYLWHTEGLTDRNKGLLNAFAEQIIDYGGPWVLCGDYNFEPSVLCDSEWGSQWLKLVGGVPLYDREVGSCKGPNGRACLDWSIIDKRLAAGATAETVLDEGVCSPHSPIVFKIGKLARQQKVWKLVTPKHWPCEKPIGCQSPPPSWPKPLATGSEAAIKTQKQMDEYWQEIGAVTELEVNTFFNFEGNEFQSRQGHFQLPVYKQVPLLPNLRINTAANAVLRGPSVGLRGGCTR